MRTTVRGDCELCAGGPVNMQACVCGCVYEVLCGFFSAGSA